MDNPCETSMAFDVLIIYDRIYKKERNKYIFSTTQGSTLCLVSFSHTRTNKLACVLKTKKVTFLGMQNCHDNRQSQALSGKL